MSYLIEKEGYAYKFDPSACAGCGGRCCTGESGNIFVATAEIKRIVDMLQIDIADFYAEYLVKKGYRFSLKEIEREGAYDCVFFSPKNGGCMIYEARPSQCRSFPFWDYYKKRVDALKAECPGIVDA